MQALKQSFVVGGRLGHRVRNGVVVGQQRRHLTHTCDNRFKDRQLRVKWWFLRHVTHADARLPPDVAVIERTLPGERAQQ